MDGLAQGSSRETVRKFEEYEAGYESYRIITSPVLREIRLSVKK